MKHCHPSTHLIRFVVLSALIHLFVAGILATLNFSRPVQSLTFNREGELIATIRQSTAEETVSPNSSPSSKAVKNPSISAKPIVQAVPLSKEYYEIRELDKAIGPLTDIQPQFPPLSNMSGSMTLDLYLDEFGTVKSVLPKDSTLPEDYTQAAVSAFINKSFEPGLINQIPVKVHLRISFELIPEINSVERN